MSTARALAGLTTGLALPCAVAASFGHPASFLDVGALLLAPGLGIAVTFGLRGGRHTLAALSAALRSRGASADVRDHVATLQTLRQALLGGAALALLVGAEQAFRNLDEPSQLGPAIATCLLGVLYGGTLAELVVAPLTRRLQTHRPEAKTLPLPTAPYAFVVLTTVAFFSMSTTTLYVTLGTGSAEPDQAAEYIRLNEGLAAGHMFTLRSFKAKMWAEDGVREATFSLALQAKDGEGDALEAVLESRSPIIRESVLLLALDTKAAGLGGSGGLETFQSRIKRELLVVLEPEGLGLQAVYLTDFNLSTD